MFWGSLYVLVLAVDGFVFASAWLWTCVCCLWNFVRWHVTWFVSACLELFLFFCIRIALHYYFDLLFTVDCFGFDLGAFLWLMTLLCCW